MPTYTPSIVLLNDLQSMDLDTDRSYAIYHASKYLVTDRQIATELTKNFPPISLGDITIVSLDVTELVVGLELQQPNLLVTQGCESAPSCCREPVAVPIAEAIIDTYHQVQGRQLACPNPIWQSFRELQIASDYHRDNLIEIQEKLSQAQQSIASMKTTKFWQMREQWFALKRRLKLIK